ncbi:hypothetical protein F383_23978 [Gossypium arboreum]|uniref:Uncharacterized protein n=1 Tax=Gossypium arboreum TaxID=29729 RepID=A0A0B0MU06_GOSAR|nr:hypothetical protein F383_23978 [Gossypium arboreum]
MRNVVYIYFSKTLQTYSYV